MTRRPCCAKDLFGHHTCRNWMRCLAHLSLQSRAPIPRSHTRRTTLHRIAFLHRPHVYPYSTTDRLLFRLFLHQSPPHLSPLSPSPSPSTPCASPTTMTPPPALTATISPTHALHLLASTPAPPLIDARPLASHLLERIVHSLHSPSLPTLTNHPLLLFYDAGSSSLTHFSSPAPAAVAFYAARLPPTTRLLLVQGGLPAIRHAAPHLVETDRSAPTLLRNRLAQHPWALRLLTQVTREAQPPASILPWLFVGAVAHAYKREIVRSYAFTHIVVAAGELEPRFRNLIRYLTLPAQDTPVYQLKRHFPAAVAFLHDLRLRYDAGDRLRCLVHCYAGASRSVALVAAYLIWSDRVSVQVALDFVKGARHAAQPNHGFVKQLGEWEKEVKAGMHRHLGSPPAEPLIGSFSPTQPMNNVLFMDTDEDDDDEDYDDDEMVEEEPLELLKPSHMSTERCSYPSVRQPSTPFLRAAADTDPAAFGASSPVSPAVPPPAGIDHRASRNVPDIVSPHSVNNSSTPPHTLTLTRPFHHHSSTMEGSVSADPELTLNAYDDWTAKLSDIE